MSATDRDEPYIEPVRVADSAPTEIPQAAISPPARVSATDPRTAFVLRLIDELELAQDGPERPWVMLTEVQRDTLVAGIRSFADAVDTRVQQLTDALTAKRDYAAFRWDADIDAGHKRYWEGQRDGFDLALRALAQVDASPKEDA